MSTKKKCTILGANGYIGQHVCVCLHKLGFDVFAYDIQTEKTTNIPSEIAYESFNICSDFEKVNLNVDFLFVFSGLTGTKNGFDKFSAFIETNEIGLLNLLNKIRYLEKKPKVIFPSTRLVYRGSEIPLIEDAEKFARTIYAVNKIAAESLLQIYADCFAIKFVIYRICVPYGNLFDDKLSYGTMNLFLNKAKNGEPIELFDDGNMKRTFTYIGSLCLQIIHSMDIPESDNQIFNISGETYTLREIATEIARRFNSNVVFIPWNSVDLAIESGDTVFDSSKIESLISIDRSVSLLNWLDFVVSKLQR